MCCLYINALQIILLALAQLLYVTEGAELCLEGEGASR